MLFFIVLAVATAAAALVRRHDPVQDHVRRGLGLAMVFAGIAHLVMPQPFIQHLPEWVPARGELIALTGFVEIGLGAALFAPGRWRELAGLALAAYLVAVFPSNVYVAVEAVDVDGQPGGIHRWLRLPFQALFISAAVWSTRLTGATSARRYLRTIAGQRLVAARLLVSTAKGETR